MSNKFKEKDFTFEEDFIISAECDDCGYITDNEDEFEEDCPECGGTLLKETSHEGNECAVCGFTFDMWDNAYRHNEDNFLICEDCYEGLE